ncbi:MAG: hypothetical protein AABY22_07515 [Nanoarchaeota archaeon]
MEWWIRENLADRKWWEDKKIKFDKDIDDKIKELKEIDIKKEDLTDDEIKFLRETIEIIKIYPEYLNGKIMEYMDKFSKRISKNKFMDLLNDYDETKIKKLKRLEYWIKEVKPKCKMLSDNNCKWTKDICNMENCRALKGGKE